MPYLAHFGLEEHPFTLTPDVDYFFPTQEHANIIGSVEFALRRDTGIIKVIGAVGTGKTLLCRLLIKKLVDSEAVAYINAPRANANSIILAICREFGIEVGTDADAAYHSLNGFLVEEHGKNRLAVLVVDEAQHLGKEGLELVRLVSNLETEKRKLLQIVLFGQTELDELLADPSLRQLTQRIAFSLETKPLTVEESKRYIGHRISVSRRQGVEYDVFSPRAVDLLARSCGGIPRVLNIVADKSLLAAFAAGSAVVQPAHVAEAIKESPALIRPVATRHSPVRRIFGRVAAYFGGLVIVATIAVFALAALPGGQASQRARALIHAVGGIVEGEHGPTSAAPAAPEPASAAATVRQEAAASPVAPAAEGSGPSDKSDSTSAALPAGESVVAVADAAREATPPTPQDGESPKEATNDAVEQLAAAAEMPKPLPPIHRNKHRTKAGAKKKPDDQAPAVGVPSQTASASADPSIKPADAAGTEAAAGTGH